MNMQNLCGVNRVVRGGFVGLVLLGVLGLAGCERGDRVAVVEAPSEVEASEGATRRAKSAMYSAKVEQDSVAVGQPSEVVLAIEPGNDLKINLDFPWKIEMQEKEGVVFTSSAFGKSDFSLQEERATIPVVMNLAKAGEHEVEAVADFSVCNDDRCEILRGENLVFKIRGVEETNE